MKRTKIHYREKRNGRIEITGYGNVATRLQIYTAFGIEVMDKYFAGYPHYYQRIDGGFRIDTDGCPVNMEVDHKNLTKEEFDFFISKMREAGNRLCEIRKDVAAHKIKTVVI